MCEINNFSLTPVKCEEGRVNLTNSVEGSIAGTNPGCMAHMGPADRKTPTPTPIAEIGADNVADAANRSPPLDPRHIEG
jgi:hypothetical protein